MEHRWGDIAVESVLSSVSDAVCGLDAETRITFWNDAATELFGYQRENTRGERLTELIDIDSDQRQTIESIVTSSEPIESKETDAETFELKVKHAHGAPVPIEMTVTRATEDEAICIARPSYEKPAFPEYLELLQGSFIRRAIEESTDLIVGADRNERILFANKRYRDFFGLDEAVHGETLDDMLPIEVYSEVRPYFEDIIEGETVKFETERIGPEGNKHVMEDRYYPLTTKDDEIIGGVAAIREITELKNRGRSLRDSWETYRDLLDGCPEPILISDTDGEILEANQKATQVFGYSEETLLDQSVGTLCSRDRNEEVIENIETGEATSEVFDAYCKTSDGETLPVTVTSSWINYFGSGAILCVAKQHNDADESDRT